MRGVVRNRHVLVTESAAHLHHRFDRVTAVAELGVHVEIAADVALRQQRRQRMALCGLDLVRAVANLGGNERQAERGVNLLLGRGRTKRAVGAPEAVPREAPFGGFGMGAQRGEVARQSR